ncbi:MAG: GDSL-type esterase/lipase family protein [Alistipes sp.]|jgi:lysophospholipase L1-like esterase|nr:GDSL-type esterase/lipase family protein [Alistipes sp.]
MKKIAIMLASIAATIAVQNASAQQGNDDPANLGRYAEANTQLKASGARPDVVFMGNSITDAWPRVQPDMFSDGSFVGRGISGQVTAQMLARFQADVIDLRPMVVVILAGTNDIAENRGPVSLEQIAANIFAMATLARDNGIAPVICSVLPAAEYPWRRQITDVPAKVRALNAMLKEWAAANRCEWVDYHTPMADERGGLPARYAEDGIHPTAAGYARMTSIITPTIDALLR